MSIFSNTMSINNIIAIRHILHTKRSQNVNICSRISINTKIGPSLIAENFTGNLFLNKLRFFHNRRARSFTRLYFQ